MARSVCKSPHVAIGDFVGRGSLGAPWPLHEHSHEQVQITILTPGNSVRADWITDVGSKRQKHIQGPAVCVTPALQPHSMVLEEAAGTMMILVSAGLLGEHTKSLRHPGSNAREEYGLRDRPLLDVADLVIRTRDAGLPITALYAEAAALKLLDCVSGFDQSLAVRRTDPCPRIGRVFEFIETHLETDLSLVALAQVARTSPYHFARQFKASAGMSPHQYVIRRRVERAKGLLAGGCIPIADVAQSCGFATQSHLTTVFRREVGTTPRAYRRQAT